MPKHEHHTLREAGYTSCQHPREIRWHQNRGTAHIARRCADCGALWSDTHQRWQGGSIDTVREKSDA